VTSVLLTLQPLTSLVLGVVLLGEEPTGLQVAGAVLVLIGLLTATSRSRVSARAPVRESA
jgi:drug/metabolite transporter (DMT)-like permease